ncbi:uncharacterized protein STEHIDRAFT_151270 [Stereum hirsutum FP-91666 SS1]|uniref:uncharacterized protein n=1 Tax=Stereum hirsutum (strain FP-91666) TaxID=721885 RepID=UPI000440AADC|nr:uncharacterized protein STEHIDRAFT_151270 [Stereum hirsutum FP-91666 SS1]EIM91915.1 hypothetical protein STEHIDRAFT_151270 [Stereum hirsutum FP-91666 SS1]
MHQKVNVQEKSEWLDLQRRRWIPSQAKEHVEHEPRNGLLMCPTHHKAFDAYEFFIRYMPEARKFVFFNYTGRYGEAPFHGKAIALDIGHRHAPFPALFIHELRVRAHNPFHFTFQSPDEIQWQDWITSLGILNADSTHGFFDSNSPSPAPATSSTPPQQPQMQQGDTSVLSDGPVLGLDSATIYKILAATRESASWKACVMEGTSWDGTADENREKYQALFGVGAEDV